MRSVTQGNMDLMSETALPLSRMTQNLKDDAVEIFNRSANSMEKSSFSFLIW
jgi:hypothetical protein